ncbi:MAG TPA: efflux RND transporter periplasmic adaptor subunit [Verrucomicrobiales bacterium]|nr:efflux RND transporter periplasmic adaptor subunit [Verrucomicrobiales bacterium]
MTRSRTLILIALILGGAALLSLALWKFQPTATKVSPARILPTVEFETVQREDYQVYVKSQGIVEAVTESTLAAEVSGRVDRVAPSFLAGESFQTGDILLEIDSSDYQAALSQAHAALQDARLALETEKARGDQARRDWEKLGRGGAPADLVLRIPHRESAAAKLAAAEAALRKAEHDLERCEVRAPYTGRIIATHTDIGAYITAGSPLADIYASRVLEARLPVSLDDYIFLHPPTGNTGPAVQLSAPVGGSEFRWPAAIVRSEGAIDRTSRSIRLVARLNLEAHDNDPKQLLRPGLFVQARIEGMAFSNIIRIPRRALRNDSQVLVIDDSNRLRFRDVSIRWRDPAGVVLAEGLQEGERLCITFLEGVTDGMPVVPIPSIANETTSDF